MASFVQMNFFVVEEEQYQKMIKGIPKLNARVRQRISTQVEMPYHPDCEEAVSHIGHPELKLYIDIDSSDDECISDPMSDPTINPADCPKRSAGSCFDDFLFENGSSDIESLSTIEE